MVAPMSGYTAHLIIDIEGWAVDCNAVLAESSSLGRLLDKTLLSQVSFTGLVDLVRNRIGVVRRLMRRLYLYALLDNVFHSYVQWFYGVDWLFDRAYLLVTADSDVGDTQELAAVMWRS